MGKDIIDTTKNNDKKEEEKTADQIAKEIVDKKNKDTQKDDKGRPLTKQDIIMLRRYGKGPYHNSLNVVEKEVTELNQKITSMCGIKESDTGLALPASWNLEADKMMLK